QEKGGRLRHRGRDRHVADAVDLGADLGTLVPGAPRGEQSGFHEADGARGAEVPQVGHRPGEGATGTGEREVGQIRVRRCLGVWREADRLRLAGPAAGGEARSRYEAAEV